MAFGDERVSELPLLCMDIYIYGVGIKLMQDHKNALYQQI